VAEQELDVFEFASGTVAEPSTGTTKVVRRQVIHSNPLGVSLYCCPNNIRRADDSESDSRNERYRYTIARLNPILSSEQYQAMNLSIAFL
jgi:hypothetical protein